MGGEPEANARADFFESILEWQCFRGFVPVLNHMFRRNSERAGTDEG